MAPNITIEPKENGRVVYLSVCASSAGEPQPNMLAFRLRIDNSGPDAVEEHLQQIEVTLTRAVLTPNNPSPDVHSFDRDIKIAAGRIHEEYLSSEESIKLPSWPDFQASIRARLTSGWVKVSGLLQSTLVTHRSPDPEGSYQFPFSAADLGENEYITTKAQHTGGSQHFGYDIGATAWDPVAKAYSGTPGADRTQNSHFAIMGKPVYAMSDGEVVSFDNDEPGNPVPGKRCVQPLGLATDDGPITSMSVVQLTGTRLVTAARNGDGNLEIRVWDSKPADKLLFRRGLFTGGSIVAATVARISSSRFVVALAAADNTFKLVAFDVSPNGLVVSQKGQGTSESGSHVVLTPIAKGRVAVVSAPALGQVRVASWEVSADGMTVNRLAIQQVEGFPRLASCAITIDDSDASARLVTAARTADNKLRLTTWDVVANGTVLFRVHKDGGPGIDAALSARNTREIASAVRDAQGVLRVAVWQADSLGNLSRVVEHVLFETPTASVTWVGSVLATAPITAAGIVQVILLNYDDDKKTIAPFGEMVVAGPADLAALTPLQTNPLILGAMALRDPSGTLGLQVFRVLAGGGNNFVLKHGDETVLYAHMVQGSLSPALCAVGAKVKKGQFLGNAGNSGSSSNPHLHIHATDVASSAYRPLPFHGAKAVGLETPKLPAPPAVPPFATANDQGFYWQGMAIKPTW